MQRIHAHSSQIDMFGSTTEGRAGEGGGGRGVLIARDTSRAAGLATDVSRVVSAPWP